MADIADTTLVHRAPMRDEAATRAAPVPLASVGADAWRGLAERTVEPNGYYLPDWEMAVDASARGRTNASAICAFSDTRLTGLLPVVPMWRAYGIPLPALVSADPYGSLCTPLLDREQAEAAALELMRQARAAGAHALLLRAVALDGPAMKAFREELRRDGLRVRLLQSHLRAALDATRDADEVLQEALGAKKLKELRRQRNRLADHGAVQFDVARTPDEVAPAVETFLALEASGWKARRGTALAQDQGDAAFIRRATVAMAARGQCEIISLRAGDTPVAAGVVLRHGDRAFFFKLGVDERFAKYSPGVQLTLELTRHLCADPLIRFADSTAAPDHPMINPIWRSRLAIGDVLVPLQRHDVVVPLIRAALALRQAIREPARRAVHFLRRRRESRQEKST
ncbi:GNAT family N-acetyltransferase [Bradyrhizobium sp.]|uniref:GNAT family N-acetyltransferase n=1 Tax=Bradyrhizobium sp. TaxID=376 RepID=UPI004037B63A